jgi:hypothetical protein
VSDPLDGLPQSPKPRRLVAAVTVHLMVRDELEVATLVFVPPGLALPAAEALEAVARSLRKSASPILVPPPGTRLT